MAQYGGRARDRWRPYFERASVPYPPARVVLVGLKEEKRLEVYACGPDDRPRFVRDYPILRLSGKAGPKLEYGDGQVPEGIYPMESLHPNSAFHLALRVGYPNEFDRQMAQRDGRNDLGGDIMIHGGRASVGCLAMGDPTAEDLFVLGADTGVDNLALLLCPTDLRVHPAPQSPKLPSWTPDLYADMKRALMELGPGAGDGAKGDGGNGGGTSG